MRVPAALIVCFFLVWEALGQTAAKPVLEFPASGDPKAHDEFVLGVIALHSSAYDDAAEHFHAAERIDPNFVMAYWGEAMTFNHPFWNQQDIAGARRALMKLAPTRSEREGKAATPRERAYLSALEILYGDGDRDSRDFAFADAMKKVAFDYPQDYEASAFYVLALLGTRRIGDPAYPQKQASAAAVLEAILKKYPEHPGALHYLMHTYDDPEHASLALDAARKYEKIPAGDFNFHAMHMPSHIYLELGLWPDVARCNQAAYGASDRWVTTRNLNVARRDYHSLEYLQYAELQMGQYAKARDALSLMVKSAAQIGLAGMIEETSTMVARTAIETGEWSTLTMAPQSNQLSELVFARALAALSEGHIEPAKAGASLLESRATADAGARRLVHASAEDLLKNLLLSRIALAEKHSTAAKQLGLDAVKLEANMDIPVELNGIVKPAAEFYGELLLDLREPKEAADQFSAALKEKPMRAMSILGLARAQAMMGDTNGARQAYEKLAVMWKDADTSLPAVREINAFLRQ